MFASCFSRRPFAKRGPRFGGARGARRTIATLLLAGGLAGPPLAAADAPINLRGLPFTRFYSFDEIGSLSAGARLTFDPLGRLMVVQQGACVVLNDTTWLDLAGKVNGKDAVLQMIDDGHGRLYYGATGAWGTVDFASGEKLQPRSLVPHIRPDWITTTNFTESLATNTGVYFAGWNGVVFWDKTTREHTFFNVVGVTKLFALGDRVFVFSHSHRAQYIDVTGRALRDLDSSALDGTFIDQTTSLDENHVLVATGNQRLMRFDGENFSPWASELGSRLNGRVSALRRLADGSVAIAVSGEGLYLVAETGRLFSSLTDPEHHRITDLAAREPGVLWVMNENGVEKVLYRSPVTVFGQRLGLPISWPQVVRWHNRIVVASGGRLYETAASPEPAGATARFQPVETQPAGGLTWALAANGPRLLVGNTEGVFARNDDGGFTRVLSGMDVARLVMTSADFCYVLGESEITALRWENGGWVECAARVPGVGYPAIIHAVKGSAWVESLGGSRAARITFRDGQLHTRVFEQFPWPEPNWVNIGVVGDTVILTSRSPAGGRLYFDERTERFVSAPQLERLLGRAPFWINRVRQDSEGTLWATHDRGVFTLHPQGESYVIDATRFDVINERNLNIQLLPGGDIWLSTGQSLYHVNPSSVPETRPTFKPILVSVVHGRTYESIAGAGRALHSPFSYPYADNSLSLRFFAGSYATRRAPGYEFRLNRPPNNWTSLGTGSLLTLPNLQEGAYRVEVRLADSRGPLGEPLALDFEIGPPWFRIWQAYALYGVGAALAALGLLRWLIHRADARNAALEKLVQERTRQLKVAMAKLNEETRNAATLAERDRLAGEIHDSLQQGLSGVMLQLDATLKLPSVTDDVRSRLSVARNMVSFTRHEVQNAVWDMESPLLEGTELSEALRKIAALVGPGTARVEITVAGAPAPLSSSTKHHLLRIAQEAITNAVRHAAAERIVISLAYEPQAVTLTVMDDGNGFIPDEVLTKGLGHFGLRGLRGRAGKIGGELRILSAPGEGTIIKIVVPISITTAIC